MGDAWDRDTRVCTTIDLRPDLLDAIRAYADLHELEGLEAQALVCFETTSKRKKKPSLIERMAGGGHKGVTQAAIVTPTRLVFAMAADGQEAVARSELLAKLEVTDYEKSPAFSVIEDHGLEVYGIVGHEGGTGTLFFGLGEGPDADHARHVLKAAVKAAHGEGPPVDER